MTNKNIRRSFTLIELLVVMAIIGVLASTIYVAVNQARERAKAVVNLQFSTSMDRALALEATSEWNFDDNTGKDTSGNGLNATVNGATYVDDSVYQIVGQGGGRKSLSFTGTNSVTIPDNPKLDFGTRSFSISMWGKHIDFTYPKGWFMIKKSGACYQAGNPGWDIGHSYNANGINICYTDGVNKVGNFPIVFDIGSKPNDLKNSWVFLAVVVDKNTNKISFYVNGKKQTNELDISTVTGSVDNNAAVTIGTMYGWKTDGFLDDVQIYNSALNASEIQKFYVKGTKRRDLLSRVSHYIYSENN